MRIRPWHAGRDVRPVAELVVRAWHESYASFVAPERMPDVARREAVLRELPDAARLWVAEDEHGTVLGVVAVLADEVQALYVDPPKHGRGVGTALLAHAEAAIRDAGHHGAALWVFADNAAARRFYERRGWAPDGAEAELWPGTIELRYARDL